MLVTTNARRWRKRRSSEETVLVLTHVDASIGSMNDMIIMNLETPS
jgi:hypothetical protein